MTVHHRHIQDEKDIEEILRIAIRKEVGGEDLRQRLDAIAREAGIPPEALLKAEQEWMEERERRRKELARLEYQQECRGLLRSKVWETVGAMLLPVGISVIFDWLPDQALGWSLYVVAIFALIAFHEVVSVLLKPRDEKRFEAWYKKRQSKSE